MDKIRNFQELKVDFLSLPNYGMIDGEYKDKPRWPGYVLDWVQNEQITSFFIFVKGYGPDISLRTTQHVSAMVIIFQWSQGNLYRYVSKYAFTPIECNILVVIPFHPQHKGSL